MDSESTKFEVLICVNIERQNMPLGGFRGVFVKFVSTRFNVTIYQCTDIAIVNMLMCRFENLKMRAEVRAKKWEVRSGKKLV
jgi:hypothetical protein